jgi:hypothetical protein
VLCRIIKCLIVAVRLLLDDGLRALFHLWNLFELGSLLYAKITQRALVRVVRELLMLFVINNGVVLVILCFH